MTSKIVSSTMYYEEYFGNMTFLKCVVSELSMIMCFRLSNLTNAHNQ